MVLIDFGKDFLLLGLRINKIISGFVDAYFGPRELQSIVKNEEIKSPKTLLNSCKNCKMN
ncbi:unnamed protein product [marine sediment metagenome]|uniref:Uncharacterized protein n=1 Tax=marine sediment metagenome TaxID=412755 RepID=X1AC90_9ZZZZ